jgi:hypothetical protein
MHQPNETRIGRSREFPKGAEGERFSAHRNGTLRSDLRLRVVRVPGGFAYVEDKAAAGRS